MKKIILLLTAFLLISFFGCAKKQVEKGNLVNKKRPVSPQIEKVTTYKTSPEDTIGTISSEEFYDEAGNRVKYVGYDYYGSGEVDSKTTYTYDDKGNKIKMDDGETVTIYTYNEKNLLMTESWKRGRDGSKAVNTYNDHDDLLQTKYYTVRGKFDFSRDYQYTYDDSGNVIEEWKWEKYTDGSADLEQYHIKYKYDKFNRQIEKSQFIADGGDVYLKTVHHYDKAGNELEVTEYKDGSDIANGMTINQFNEYGEIIKEESFHCDDVGNRSGRWNITTWEYDQYGNVLNNMSINRDGEDFGDRRVIVYRGQ